MVESMASVRRLATIACSFAVLAAPVVLAGTTAPAPTASVLAWGPDRPDPVDDCWHTRACGGDHHWE